jgi:hypothetical protein
MDRQRFDTITSELMERAPRSNKYRQRLNRDKKRGRELPESYDECMIWILKPKFRACEDCEIISACTEKTISLERTPSGLQWWKKCEECGKKHLFVKKKIE